MGRSPGQGSVGRLRGADFCKAPQSHRGPRAHQGPHEALQDPMRPTKAMHGPRRAQQVFAGRRRAQQDPSVPQGSGRPLQRFDRAPQSPSGLRSGPRSAQGSVGLRWAQLRQNCTKMLLNAKIIPKLLNLCQNCQSCAKIDKIVPDSLHDGP